MDAVNCTLTINERKEKRAEKSLTIRERENYKK